MAAVSALAKSKMIFAGDQSVTETSVISRFIYHKFHTTYQASIGVDFRPKANFFEDPTPRLQLRQQVIKHRWRTPFALDTGGSPSSGNQDSEDGDNTGLGRTRLGIIVRAAAKELVEKLNAARKNFPVKIFLLLLGFYTANALATILGQTGDWDVLVAGVVVSAIEGIGMLMYRKPFSRPIGRWQSFVVMVNYWKAGVCLGLFVDAFKLGS